MIDANRRRRSRKFPIKGIITGITTRVPNYVFRALFPICQRMGFHITRNHYYEPVPDTRALDDKLWQLNSELIGVDMKEEEQLKLLSELVINFRNEYDRLPMNKAQTLKPYDYYINNGSFESVDGEILYCMIRYFKPKKIFEIGSGYSTYLTARAVLKNEEENDIDCQFVTFDPYPNDVAKAGFPGLSQLEQRKIQDVPLTRFSALEKNDILFIDSSHTLRIGSDVQYEYLEILPRLNKGVIVHVHDIFLPSEYPRRWVLESYRFWTEQYLLQAFLTFNSVFAVLLAGSYLHLKCPHELEAAFTSYNVAQRWPASFWMTRVK